MKILMIAPQCFLLPRGTPLSILGRLRALSLQGHEVDLVTYPFGEDVNLPGLTIHRIRKLPGLREIKVGPSWKKIILDLLVFFKVISFLREKNYDLIYSHEEGAYFGSFLARFCGVRHLYDMHSSLPQQLSNFNFCNFAPIVRTFRWLEKQAVRHSGTIIVVYPQLQNHVNALAPGKRVFLIENTDDLSKLEREEKKTETLRASYNINGRKVVVYTGSFEPYQGLDLLLESARLVVQENKQVLFLCIGGSNRERERLQKLIHVRQLDSYFILPGIIPVYEVPAHLELADILVSPRTKGTNTPLKIYSYLRAGKAIVATNLPTHVQVLNPRVALLTEPTPQAFAEGLVRALDNPELRQSLGQGAMKLAAEKYGYSTFLEKTRAALDFVPQTSDI
jgi:glycosyltransferase involved in cell wall biosynthesis